MKWAILWIAFIFKAHAIDLAFMSSLERQTLAADLQNLCHIGDRPGAEEGRRIFRETFGFAFDCQALSAFLKQHVQLIVKDWAKRKSVLVPDFEEGRDVSRVISQYARAANLGGILYQLYREEFGDGEKLSFRYPVAGEEREILLAPESGIIQVSNSFFVLSSSSMVASLLRLSSLFHEAAHISDPGLGHVVCQSGLFKGRLSCDDSLRSAYGLQGMFLVIAASLCDECSDGEKRHLTFSGRNKLRRVNSLWPFVFGLKEFWEQSLSDW